MEIGIRKKCPFRDEAGQGVWIGRAQGEIVILQLFFFFNYFLDLAAIYLNPSPVREGDSHLKLMAIKLLLPLRPSSILHV